MELTSCSLTVAECVPIAAGLRRPGLLSLNVSNNPKLGDAGVAALADVLPPTLTDLKIYKTSCGEAGMAAISHRIATTLPHLERLYCSDNGAIGLDGWTQLGVALAALPNLVELRANRCAMGSATALALVLPRAAAACRRSDS